MTRPVAVYLEIGSKRVFSGALDWPGWCRAAKTEEDALAALLRYGGRYRLVAQRAGLDFRPAGDRDGLEVVERLKGGPGTDFGVPGEAPSIDATELTPAELERQLAILTGCWAAFDEAAAAAVGVKLRTGPRGGGRSLEKIRAHVLEADEAYLRQLGSRPPKQVGNDVAHTATLRDAIVATLAVRARGEALVTPNNVQRPWLPRYHVRRAAWHALDHAWEVEDRSRPEVSG